MAHIRPLGSGFMDMGPKHYIHYNDSDALGRLETLLGNQFARACQKQEKPDGSGRVYATLLSPEEADALKNSGFEISDDEAPVALASRSGVYRFGQRP